MNEAQYLKATDQWVQQVVIELSLCPFAWKSISENKLNARLIVDKSIDKILEGLMEEIYFLEKNPEIESSLITIPNAFATFQDFLEGVDQAKELMRLSGFEGVYQLASFHPEFQFAGTNPEDPENYTNRSPYPVWHPIRESSMSAAIDSYPKIDEVGPRNIKKMNDLGLTHVRQLLKNCYPH